MEKKKSTKLPNINQPFTKKTTYINFESLNSINKETKESKTPPPKTPSDLDDSFTLVENEKLMVQVFNSEKTYDMLSEFILNENRSIKDQPVFNKTKYSSIDSHETYYDKYKNFTNIKRKGLVQIKTPSFEYIKACNTGMLVPNPLGLISRKGNENQLNLKNQKIGDRYLKALSEGLKYSDHLDELYLSSNRLTFYGVNPLMASMQLNQKLSKRLKVLDLSFNKIGSESVKKIVDFIAYENCELQRLNLEGNSIGDEMIIKLCDTISRSISDKLTYLNFGKNLISDESAQSLSNLIANCQLIEEMILCWNNIRNWGASLIFNKLRKHNEMKIFDISWNSIGNNLVQETTQDEILRTCTAQRTFYNMELNDFRKTNVLSFKKYNFPNAPQQFKDKKQKNAKETTQKKEVKASAPIVKQISIFAKELGEYFKESAIQLVHLDISHNNIPREDCEHLAQCVKSNHTILGIHVDGNEMTIDALGFLHPYKEKKKEDYYAKSQIYYQIGSSQGNTFNLSKLNQPKVRKIRAKNNCWICEGWREVEIKFSPPQEICDSPGSHHVKMHLNCDDWKQYDTLCSGKSYFNTRMCPPGELQYVFSIDKNIMTDYGLNSHDLKEDFTFHFDHEYTKEFENLQLMKKYTKLQENDSEAQNENNEQEDEEIESQDSYIIKTVGSIHVDFNRHVLDEYNRKTMKYCLPRPERNFNKFIKPRTPWTFGISLWATFNYEYEGDSEEYIDQVFENDFSRVLKDKEEIRPILRENYKKILDCYRLISSETVSAVWQIEPGTLKEFVSRCPGLLDNNYMISDVQVIEKGLKNIDKAEKSKNKLRTLPDNLVRHQFLLLLPNLARDKYVRTGIYGFTEAVIYSMNNHFLPFMKEIDLNTWRKEKYYNEPIDNFLKAHMPIFDAVFKSWVNKEPGKKEVWMTVENFTQLVSKIVDETFPLREIPIIFNSSMKLQVDEINSERHLKMQFYEFLEAICRVMDKVKSPYPLITKLENSLPQLIKCITNTDYKLVREKFPLPTKEPGTDLYLIDYTNSFFTGLDFRVQKAEKGNSRKSVLK